MSGRARPTLLLLVAAWVAVVVLVAGATWWAIDSAGRQVLTSGSPAPLPSSGTTPDIVSSPSEDVRSPGARASGSPSPSRTQGATAPAVPGPAGATPTSAPSTRDEPTPEPTPGPTTGPASGTPSQPPPPQTQVRSWQGAAGTVTVACRGATISLQSVTPSDGWGFEVDDHGTQRVRVDFESREEDERRTEVESECGGGAPRFEVRSDD